MSLIAIAAGVVAFTLGLGQFRELGRADAQNMMTVDAGVGSGSVAAAAATDDASSSPATETPRAAAPDASDVERLWRGGQFVAAGTVIAYLLLTLLLKLDPKRAFYWTAGLAAIGFVVESVAAGVTPNLPMLVTAGTVLAAILARGPGSPAPPPK